MMWDGWSGFGMLWVTLFWVGLILLVVWAVRQFSGDRTGRNTSKDRAMQILEERYAHGEIDRDEFEEHRRTLRES